MVQPQGPAQRSLEQRGVACQKEFVSLDYQASLVRENVGYCYLLPLIEVLHDMVVTMFDLHSTTRGYRLSLLYSKENSATPDRPLVWHFNSACLLCFSSAFSLLYKDCGGCQKLIPLAIVSNGIKNWNASRCLEYKQNPSISALTSCC